LRSLLLAGSQNEWLRRQSTKRASVRRAVSRFMPGETADDALRAAADLRGLGLGTILTELGENVTSASEADAEVARYLDLGARIRAAGLDAELSVKLTHLGLDHGVERTVANVERIAAGAEGCGRHLWIDMEGTAYTDRTIEVFRRVHAGHANVGLCLQSYLRRTPADLDALLPLAPAIRLVKGAYQEPPHLAFPKKSDVDESFFRLATRLLSADARRAGAWLVAGTHDRRLIARVEAHAASEGVPPNAYEFALLYGIARDEQLRLARGGSRTRVLISFGSHWFPWYMRRLAERPANLLFVARSALGG
jgi:proline dehydrogenase